MNGVDPLQDGDGPVQKLRSLCAINAWGRSRRECEPRVRVDGRQSFNGTRRILNAALASLGPAYVSEELVLPHTNGCGMIESARSHFEAARIREASCRPDLQRGSDRNSAFLN
jgi:hypothetical protein